MNALMEEIYSTVIPSAPYIIAAYALVWLIFFVFVIATLHSLKKTKAHIALLEEMIQPDDLVHTTE